MAGGRPFFHDSSFGACLQSRLRLTWQEAALGHLSKRRFFSLSVPPALCGPGEAVRPCAHLKVVPGDAQVDFAVKAQPSSADTALPRRAKRNFCWLMTVGRRKRQDWEPTVSSQRAFQKQRYERLLLYLQPDSLTPCISAHFIRDCRYAMSYAILLLMKDMVSSRCVVACSSSFI